MGGTASNAERLVRHEPQGICAVEAAEANAQAMQDAIQAAAQTAAAAVGATAAEQPFVTTKVEDQVALTRGWRFPGPDRRDVLSMLTRFASQ